MKCDEDHVDGGQKGGVSREKERPLLLESSTRNAQKAVPKRGCAATIKASGNCAVTPKICESPMAAKGVTASESSKEDSGRTAMTAREDMSEELAKGRQC